MYQVKDTGLCVFNAGDETVLYLNTVKQTCLLSGRYGGLVAHLKTCQIGTSLSLDQLQSFTGSSDNVPLSKMIDQLVALGILCEQV